MKHLTFSVFATLCFLALLFSSAQPGQFQSRGRIVGQPRLGSRFSSPQAFTPNRPRVFGAPFFHRFIVVPRHSLLGRRVLILHPRHHHHIFFGPFLGYPFIRFRCYGAFWPYFVYNPYCGYPLSGYAGNDSYYAPVPYGSASIPYTDFGNYSAPYSNGEYSSDTNHGGEPATQFNQFAKQGEEAFRAGDYDRATRAWRHAIVEEPESASALIMLAQSLFAMAQYNEAAGVTQQAMMLLPEDQWLTTAKHSKSLYRSNREYLDQLSGLEKAVEKAPSDPALRLELGFQYASSDQQDLALLQLDKLVELVPDNQLGHKLRDLVGPKT